ncbi:MAG: hypothetical protein WCR54_02740 [Clostridia bacterium]
MKIHSSKLDTTQLVGGVYNISGGDVYWIASAEKKILSILGKDSLSLHIFDSDVSDINQVIGSLFSINFSNEPNVVIFRDNDFKWDIKAHTALLNLLKTEDFDNNILVLVNVELNAKENKLINIIDCSKQKPFEICNRANDFFENGIDRDALNLLIEYTNSDMARIEIESQKLMAFCEDKKVNIKDVENMVVEDSDLRIYNFVNSIIKGDNTTALKQLEKLQQRGERSSAMLAMIISQYRKVFYAALSNKSDMELASIFKIKEYAIKKARELKGLGVVRIKNTIEMLVNYEMLFKTGEMTEKMAFDCAISKLLAKEVK